MLKDVKSFLDSPSLYVLWDCKRLDQELSDRRLTAFGKKEVKIQCLRDNDRDRSNQEEAEKQGPPLQSQPILKANNSFVVYPIQNKEAENMEK